MDPVKRELWIKVLAGTGTWVSRVDTHGSFPSYSYQSLLVEVNNDERDFQIKRG